MNEMLGQDRGSLLYIELDRIACGFKIVGQADMQIHCYSRIRLATIMGVGQY